MKFLSKRIRINRQRDEWYTLNRKSATSFWFVYIVKCNDGTLYTGITKDLNRRIKEHNSTNKGAKYTRYRRPVYLVAQKSVKNQSDALKLEYKIKKQKKQNKINYLNNFGVNK